jgi:hypothetical protein
LGRGSQIFPSATATKPCVKAEAMKGEDRQTRRRDASRRVIPCHLAEQRGRLPGRRSRETSRSMEDRNGPVRTLERVASGSLGGLPTFPRGRSHPGPSRRTDATFGFACRFGGTGGSLLFGPTRSLGGRDPGFRRRAHRPSPGC